MTRRDRRTIRLDPHGPVRPRTVETVFVLEGQVIELQIADRVVETTAKHPFHVHERGWIAARDLQPGDLLIAHDEKLTPVVAVEVTERTTVVYNMRIAVDCTYFVGDTDWGFALWVHSSYTVAALDDGSNLFGIRFDGDRWATDRQKGVVQKFDSRDVVEAVIPRYNGFTHLDPEVVSYARRHGLSRDEAVAVYEVSLRKNVSRENALLGENAIAHKFGQTPLDQPLPEAMFDTRNGKYIAVEVKNQKVADVEGALRKFRAVTRLATRDEGEFLIERFVSFIRIDSVLDPNYSVSPDGVLLYFGRRVVVDGAPGVPIHVVRRDLGPPPAKGGR